MELKVLLPADAPMDRIIFLKDYIDKNSIEGIENTEIERLPHGNGQMGAGGIINSIKTLIEAAEKPVTELVKCLLRYVENYRTEITIPTKDGANIVLRHGRSMKPDELKELVVAIQKSNK